MKAQHTPGPLRVNGQTAFDNEGNDVFTCGETVGTHHAANASRLALCWNCHDELVNILQRMVDESLGGGKPCPCTIEHAMSALSKAKGE